MSEDDWSTEVRKRRLLLLASLARTVLKRDLQPMEHTALDLALDLVVTKAEASGTVPLLGEIAHTLGAPERLDRALGDQAGRMSAAAQDLAHALRRLVHGDLSGMFDAPSTVIFDPTTPMLSIDLSRLGGSGDDTALVLAMTCASAWMESALSDPDGGRRWVIYDEAWRVMRHVGLLERMQSQWKLSRGLGIANLMVIHRLSDLLSAGDAGFTRPGTGRGPPRRLQHPHHLPPGVRPARRRRVAARPHRYRNPGRVRPDQGPRPMESRRSELHNPAHPASGRARTVRHGRPDACRPPASSPQLTGPQFLD